MKNSVQALIYAALLAIGVLLGYKVASLRAGDGISKDTSINTLEEILSFIDDNYVDSVDYQTLVQYAISGTLDKLDPHSVYISKEEFNSVNDPLMGEFQGIGVQFRIERDTVMVVNTIPNGPSQQKGIHAGDRIVKVDGKNIAGIGINNDKVIKLLKGPKKTKVKLGIFRRGVNGINDYTIVRDVIPLNSLDAAFMISPDCGYMKFTSFSATTYEEFYNASRELQYSGAKSLVLDLRDNGGGFLSAAIDMADDFLAKNNVIVYTEGLHRKRIDYRAHSGGIWEKGKIVVLINEFSASASEIIAGSIQDNDRGVVVGRRSFGKGLVQEQIDLKNGAALRLTVARYHTPSGRCIQRSYGKGTEEYYIDFYKSLLLNDSAAYAFYTEKNDSLVYSTLNGRKVYGGGGIIPDSIVLKDFQFSNDTRSQIFGSGTLFQSIFDYIDQNRKSLNLNYPDINTFIRSFSVPQSLFNKIVYAGKSTSKNISAKDRDLVNVFIKANIARELFDNAAYYKVTNKYDACINMALRILN